MPRPEGKSQKRGRERCVAKKSGIHNVEIPKRAQEVFDILQKWFLRLQDGTHILYQPDPYDVIDKEKADKLVEALDEDMRQNEYYRLNSYLKQMGADIDERFGHEDFPEFSRLSTGARIRMHQELKRLVEYQKSHDEEYFDLT